jgi:UDPglucose 6-dehydrogenase
MLHEAGARVVACDPLGRELAHPEAPELDYADEPADAVAGADALLVATAWPEYSRIDPVALKPAAPVVLDARNILPLNQWQAAGWTVHRIGVGR